MSKFLFSYRMPAGYTPGQPGVAEAWRAWFEGLGQSLVTLGNPVFESTSLGECGAGTTLGGYSIVTAEDLEAAVAMAKGCPALRSSGAGVEVGVLAEVPPAS
jgi:hypothetical protein